MRTGGQRVRKNLWPRLEDSLHPSSYHDWEGKTYRSTPHDRRRQGRGTVGGRTHRSARVSRAVLSCETDRSRKYQPNSNKLRRMSSDSIFWRSSK